MEEEPVTHDDIARLESKLDAIDAMTADLRQLLKQLSAQVERQERERASEQSE